jgi:hypothetical protein
MTRSVLAPLGVLGRGLCVGAGVAGLGLLISPAAVWGQNQAPNPSLSREWLNYPQRYIDLRHCISV